MEEFINHTHHLHPRPSALKQNRLVGLRLISFAVFVVYDAVNLPPPFNARHLAFPFHNAFGDARQTRFFPQNQKGLFRRKSLKSLNSCKVKDL